MSAIPKNGPPLRNVGIPMSKKRMQALAMLGRAGNLSMGEMYAKAAEAQFGNQLDEMEKVIDSLNGGNKSKRTA